MDKEVSMNNTKIIPLGDVEHIPLGQGMCFIIRGEEVAVFRSREGTLFAVENQCPHRKGPLSEGIMGGGKIVCPLHGHKFDLATGQGSDGHECVKTFKVSEENGQVILEYPVSSGESMQSVGAGHVPVC